MRRYSKNTPVRRTTTKRKAALTGLLMLVAVAAAVGQPAGTLLEAIPRPGFTMEQIDGMTAILFEGFDKPSSRYHVNIYELAFSSRDHDGSAAVVQALLYVPVYEEPAERPVLVFGSGTTGIADGCAPSREQPEVLRWGYYRANMLAYAAAGFITIFPDYLGFNDPERPQRYFSHKAEAQMMLDAARAVYRFFELQETVVKPGQAVFTAGYSQGGHAAFAAADLLGTYAPEVPLAGMIGFAPTTDVATLFREGAYYAPYILYTYAKMYGPAAIDPSDYLQPQWSATLDSDVERMCVDQFQRYYPFDGRKLFRPQFYAALHGRRLKSEFPALAAVFEENSSGLSGHGLPALVVQGGEDIIVTTSSQDRFVVALRSAGSDVRYLVFKGVRHRYTRPVGFRASVDWMESRFSNLTPRGGGSR